ncbi:MAG TPA: hypothetical protein VLL05_06450 [Terriglobales bacterium]|nr:hypothetical protein [Terriglobales bacterium]
MLSRVLTVWVFVLAALSAAYSAKQEYVTGKILEIQQRERDKIQLYIVNTPIMTEEPYFTMAVDVNGIRYEGEFLPRSMREFFPGLWSPGDSVVLRLDKHFMYVKREDGSEARFLIVDKFPLRSARNQH